MTRGQIIDGLDAGKTLIQNQDCSTFFEKMIVDGLDPDIYEVSDWKHGRCRSCGFGEQQRTVKRKTD